jgi:alkyl hydroperoxide reductase subunit AhpF
MTINRIPFDDHSWDQLPAIFDHLPNPIRLHLWCDENGTKDEIEAHRLATLLSENFKTIDYEIYPRRDNYNFYPVFGVMGLEGQRPVDYGIRIIGLPVGYQMTSLITAIQSASFQGMTSEAMSRIQLAQLNEPISLELITNADDEIGPLTAQIIFNFAVISPFVKSYLIMGDAFQEAYTRYSINYLPHLVINERYHSEGSINEAELLHEIARLLKNE